MMYELKSKKTGAIQVVDDETYNTLTSTDQLKKYTIERKHTPVNVVPAEIILKKKQTKSDTDNES